LRLDKKSALKNSKYLYSSTYLCFMNFTSKLVQESVEAFSSLPGIGKKSALRLVLYLMNQPKEATHDFTAALVNMRENIKTCSNCHNISDTEICGVCSDTRRDRSVICVVENIRDVMAIEDTGQFRGMYHVLGGVISPIEGIGPGDLNITSLENRLGKEETKEVIMAVSPTIEGDTTIFYISKRLKDMNVKVSTIARGVSFGGELEYADEITLGRSIVARIPYRIKGE
jgi:recombination protein RecR